MRFVVVDREDAISADDKIISLVIDNWDDYGFKTQFVAYYKCEFIGCVKIGCQGMAEGQATASIIPRSFSQLPPEFFSLWQSQKSYEKVKEIEGITGEKIFEALRDIAADNDILEQNNDEESLSISLLRSVSRFACKGQFHRIADGGPARIHYDFGFKVDPETELGKGLNLSFEVRPDDYPPSSVHAVIGRNGIGKTRLLQDLILCSCGKQLPKRSLCFSLDEEDDKSSSGRFANVICVAFSPFDGYERIIELSKSVSNESERIDSPPCHYIGLNRNDANLLDDIRESFFKSYKECFASDQKRSLWNKAINILKSDPVFADACSVIGAECENTSNSASSNSGTQLEDAFKRLSSGHKVVLSIITSCVHHLEERTLVFVDEPENHLHPPLLLSFINALSFLLADRNSAAIMATHSPVVLQEIPQSCVWILDRSGDCWSYERPPFETFGASFESLMSQVFKFEVWKSGYYSMLENAVDNSKTLTEAIGLFNGRLGDVANSIIRILWATRK